MHHNTELSTGHFSWTRDPTRRNVDPTRPAIANKKSDVPDPTRPDAPPPPPYVLCFMSSTLKTISNGIIDHSGVPGLC